MPPNLYVVRDYNFSIGGPIKRDKVWFFFSPRVWGASNYILNQFFPDGSPARDESLLQSYTTRVTAQLSSKHKVTAVYDPLPKDRDYFLSETGLYDLKGSAVQNMYSHAIQAKWTSTLTNRLLVEAGYSENYTGYQLAPQDTVQIGPSAATSPWGDISKSDLAVTSRFSTNAPTQWFKNPLMSRNIVGSTSYVTGSHSLKMGMQWRFGYITADRENNGHMVQQYNNGVPLQVALYNLPIISRSELNGDFGLYIQDTWQLGKLTLNPGLRFERFNAEVAEQTSPSGRFVGERHFDRIPNLPNYVDWVPRLGAAYDLTGNGKTALKFSVGRYMEQDASAFPERYNPMTLVPASVSWIDQNTQLQDCKVPGVDKTGCNDIAEGELGCTFRTAGCELNFAQLPATFGVRRNRNPDPNLSRPYQLVYNGGISRELRPGLGISANYYHRRFYDITFTTDLAKPFSVYTPYEINDPRGNGQKMTVYNLDRAALRKPERARYDVDQQHVDLPQLRCRRQRAVPKRLDAERRNGERPVANGDVRCRRSELHPAVQRLRPRRAVPDDVQDVGPVSAAVGHPVERRLPVDGRRSHQPDVHPDSGGLSGPDRGSADGVFDHRAAPQQSGQHLRGPRQPAGLHLRQDVHHAWGSVDAGGEPVQRD